MPVEPNFLERLLLFRLDEGPAPILDLFGAAGFRAVALALDMGLFEALERGARTPQTSQPASTPTRTAFGRYSPFWRRRVTSRNAAVGTGTARRRRSG